MEEASIVFPVVLLIFILLLLFVSLALILFRNRRPETSVRVDEYLLIHEDAEIEFNAGMTHVREMYSDYTAFDHKEILEENKAEFERVNYQQAQVVYRSVNVLRQKITERMEADGMLDLQLSQKDRSIINNRHATWERYLDELAKISPYE